jgi:hypothetical protein
MIDGKETSAENVNPNVHLFIGMFRKPLPPQSDCSIMCSCGQLLNFREEGYEHYQRGHFDLPQYRTIIFSDEIKTDLEKNRGKTVSVNSEDFCLIPMPEDSFMQGIAVAIEKAINNLFITGAKAPITLRWRNIISQRHNPDGTIGFFRITAEYPVSETQNEKETK